MLISPLIVATLAMPILREPIGPRRWIEVAIRFIGALIIFRLGSELMSIGALFPAAAAISFAIYQISTGLVSLADPITTTLFYTALPGAIFTSIAALFYWTLPTARAWSSMILTGLCGELGHFSLIKAFTLSPASVIFPYGYLSLIWALLLGFYLFSKVHNPLRIIGAAINKGSGLSSGEEPNIFQICLARHAFYTPHNILKKRIRLP